jgi:formylglycine-generating enzyme required for sulfatase activity
MDVGSKPKGASPYGALDMAGNLWEWTADWHDFEYYHNSPKKNPAGPKTGTHKTCRGGDFFSRNGYEVRTTGRFPYEPSDYSIAIGFRCVKSNGK